MSKKNEVYHNISGGLSMKSGDGVEFDVDDIIISKRPTRLFKESGTIKKEHIKDKEVINTEIKII